MTMRPWTPRTTIFFMMRATSSPGFGWLALRRRLALRGTLRLGASERDALGAGGAGRRERAGGHGDVQFPVREIDLVAQAQGVVAIDRASPAGQQVGCADPHLDEHAGARVRQHVSGGASDDLGPADVEGDLQLLADGLVWI